MYIVRRKYKYIFVTGIIVDFRSVASHRVQQVTSSVCRRAAAWSARPAACRLAATCGDAAPRVNAVIAERALRCWGGSWP